MLVAEQREPWATIYTKRSAALDLVLTGPKGRFALGRIAELAADREFQAGPRQDVLRLRFLAVEDLDRGDLREFLAEHLASLASGGRKAASMTI